MSFDKFDDLQHRHRDKSVIHQRTGEWDKLEVRSGSDPDEAMVFIRSQDPSDPLAFADEIILTADDLRVLSNFTDRPPQACRHERIYYSIDKDNFFCGECSKEMDHYFVEEWDGQRVVRTVPRT